MPLGFAWDVSPGPLGGLLGASWGPLGASWGPLRALLGPPGAPETRKLDFWIFWPPLGPVLGPFWAVVGAFWAVLAPSWAILGASWERLGLFWDGLRGLLDRLQSREGRKSYMLKMYVFQLNFDDLGLLGPS